MKPRIKLRRLIDRYVAYRQALGEKFLTNRNILRAFGRSVGAKVAVATVGLPETTRFLYGHGPVTSAWHIKYAALKGFFHYALDRDHVRTIPLPDVLPERPPPFVAYIYPRVEVRRLLAATDGYQRNRSCMEPVTMRVLILLLYATGLRVHEAIALNRDQVDLDQSLLTVVRTKFYKSRLVPFTPQLGRVLRAYLARPASAAVGPSPAAPFFTTTRRGARINQCTVEGAFRRACEHAGIRRDDGARYQPRLHDLRHTFAVTRLTTWYRRGHDVQRLLPHLSVYLGHVYLAATQVYLHMTPELLQQANRRFQRYANPRTSHA
jgi:integrase/recombinase XerD